MSSERPVATRTVRRTRSTATHWRSASLRARSIACPPPVDEFERAYLDALGQVATWELDGEELVLSDADGNELLRYEVASITGSWTVTGVNTGDAVSARSSARS